MKRIVEITGVSLFFLMACSQPSAPDKSTALKNNKYSIDSLINKERNLLALAKLKGAENLEAMSSQNAGRVETVYNIFKDKSGRIIYISEMPKSPNDDWFIAYKSYFDESGNLFAFQRQNNFFKSECTNGAALENLIKYYDPGFELLDSVYTLTDSHKKDLTKTDCKFPYNFPYKIYKSVTDYQQNVKGL